MMKPQMNADKTKTGAATALRRQGNQTELGQERKPLTAGDAQDTEEEKPGFVPICVVYEVWVSPLNRAKRQICSAIIRS